MTLTAAELEEIRTFVEDQFPDTCTIQTQTETSTKGSVEVTFSNTYTSVPCRLMPVTGNDASEYVTGDKATRVAQFVLTVPYDQAISGGYRVVHGGLTYEVLGVHAGHSYRTARRADLALVDN